MLPAAGRLTRSQDFGLVVRRGRRAGRPRLVVHAMIPVQPTLDAESKVGFVVSKAVGNSVVRHRVSRRLRHVLRDRLASLPAGSSLVVRALPPAATASSAELAEDVDAALRRLVR
ncbi:ribonuclease P protein component [Actinosynnema pretiosum subsp. pretiosum]|nr:ribonuclease P protein component [Actinosynnema mirum]QUF01906.1 ribonuclease P protein component [Actinosynnema pretiosum subsp. pretiosum]